MMMMFQNFNCRAPHDPDDFLAYCRSLGFVDYEHGALYYGLEPKVRDSIRTAQVLFLGSSRLQAAFAANALRKYFKARGIRYFVMGFGYGEASAFGQPVMERSHASPKVIVINADPFFVVPEMVSEPAKDAIKGGAGYLWRGRRWHFKESTASSVTPCRYVPRVSHRSFDLPSTVSGIGLDLTWRNATFPSARSSRNAFRKIRSIRQRSWAKRFSTALDSIDDASC
jgi:hypothetical protein